jgi:hypothetical protein
VKVSTEAGIDRTGGGGRISLCIKNIIVLSVPLESTEKSTVKLNDKKG